MHLAGGLSMRCQSAQEWTMSESSTLIVGLAVRKERIDVVLALPSREGDSMLGASRATLQAAPWRRPRTSPDPLTVNHDPLTNHSYI
jgi:hypothetical protein